MSFAIKKNGGVNVQNKHDFKEKNVSVTYLLNLNLSSFLFKLLVQGMQLKLPPDKSIRTRWDAQDIE